jgi:hypothetical protein
VTPRERQRRWRNAPVVGQQDGRRARENWTLLLGIVLALFPLGVYLVQQMRFVRIQYRTEQVRESQERFTEAEQRFRLERAQLGCLSRVESEARRLGLVRPPRESVVVVVPGDSPTSGNLMARAPDDGVR